MIRDTDRLYVFFIETSTLRKNREDAGIDIFEGGGGEEKRYKMDEVNNVKECERNISKNIHENRCKCSRGRLKSQSNALKSQSHNPTSKATVIKVWCLHNVLLLANYLENSNQRSQD